MKNYQVTTTTGETFFRARDVAVVGIIVGVPDGIIDEEEKYLIARRGKTCSEPNLLAFPCGYLDWDESVEEAVLREIKEELGLDINSLAEEDILGKVLMEVDSDPTHDKRQNVVFRYVIGISKEILENLLNDGTINLDSASRGGEGDENQELIYNNYQYFVDNYKKEDWAFDHDLLLKRVVSFIQS